MTRTPAERVAALRDADVPEAAAAVLLDDVDGLLAPLHELLLDRTAPTDARRAAATLLWQSEHVAPTRDEVTAWLCGDDPVLRRYALQHHEPAHDPLLREILADRSAARAEERAAVLDAVWFDRHALVPAIVDALRDDPDDDVRVAAARALGMDEACAAEPALLAATHDPCPTVVAQAAHSLQHFPTGPVEARLAALREHPDPEVADEAEASWGWVYGRRHGFDDADDADTAVVHTPPSPTAPPTDWAALGERTAAALVPDPVLRDALGRDAPVWVDALLEHPDPGVRQAACRWMVDHRHAADLLRPLLDDPSPGVRRAATGALCAVRPDASLGAPLWARFEATRGAAATEALRAWLQHARGDTALVLDELSLDKRRPMSVRLAALAELVRRDPYETYFTTILHLIDELSPTPETWDLAILLPGYVRQVGRAVRASEPLLANFGDHELPAWLADVDHADVQRALRGD